jgi:hypothetical protein
MLSQGPGNKLLGCHTKSAQRHFLEGPDSGTPYSNPPNNIERDHRRVEKTYGNKKTPEIIGGFLTIKNTTNMNRTI